MRKNPQLVLLAGLALAGLVAYMWLIRQPFFELFIERAQQNLVLYIVVLTFLKGLALVWPPLPGSVFTLGSIPVIGWQYAVFAEILGSVWGASVAFFLGKRYGYLFLQKIFNQSLLENIRNFKVKKNKEFEAIFFLRLFTGIISEAVSYGSGMVGVRYRNFIAATFLASLLNIPLFYMASNVFAGKNIFVNIAVFFVVGFAFWKLKGRYFE